MLVRVGLLLFSAVTLTVMAGQKAAAQQGSTTQPNISTPKVSEHARHNPLDKNTVAEALPDPCRLPKPPPECFAENAGAEMGSSVPASVPTARMKPKPAS